MTSDITQQARDESIARLFHEAYERLAPSFGYETREASAKPWADVPEPNKSLMIAVAGEVRSTLSSDRITQLEEALRDLAFCEASYRAAHDLNGDGHIITGRAWDKMRHAGDRARAALKGSGQ